MDTQQKVRCSFIQAADGQQRCLPTSVYFERETVDVPGVLHQYADASCTTPLQLVAEPKPTSSCAIPTPAYAQDWDISTCVARVHIFSVGASVVPPTVTYDLSYDSNGNTSCLASTQIDTSANDYFAVGPEIDPATFAAATISTE
jgi:hypothetical protein